ncbi:MAG: LpxI family protein [Opitutales bacterium]
MADPNADSAFLPTDFDPSRPTVLIAGSGRYPELLVEQFQARRWPVRLVGFPGETHDSLIARLPSTDSALIKVGQVGKLLKHIRWFEAGYALMAGQITPGRLFKGLHPDFKAISILGRLKERNAETLFGAIAAEIEATGVQVLDARAGLDGHLATTGPMTRGPRQPDADALAFGIKIARHSASADIGQGVVVAKGTVLAVEAFEGTNRMLERAGTFGAKDTLFVKTVKAHQDFRFDVPVFGLQTLEAMQAARIPAAALQAGAVIMPDKDRVIAAADRAGITLVGFEA